MTTSETFCFIPAKSHSKRLKNKNIRLLRGKELIYYPISVARESGVFGKDIIVSTDSRQIADIAQKFGAQIPYLRNEKLAKDPYGVKDVLLDFLDRFPKYAAYQFCCISLPTAPLITVTDLQGSFKLMKAGRFHNVLSICETDHNAYRSVLFQNGTITPIHPRFLNKKSQELEVTYRINGAMVWVNVQNFMETGSYFSEPIGGYKMEREHSVDIDNPEDLQYAEFLLEQRKN